MIWYHIWEWVLVVALGIFIGVSAVVMIGGIRELYQLLFKQ